MTLTRDACPVEAATPVPPTVEPLGLVGDGTSGDALSVEAAQHLTAAIKVAAEALHTLLYRAWVGRAHVALGYPDWQSYVVNGLGLSRSRSYQLLDQQRVTLAISAAAGVPALDVPITEAAARDLKPRLAAVADEVREAVTEAHEDADGCADAAAVLRVVTTTLDAARHPQATRLNVLPSMQDLRRAGQQRLGSGDIWYTPRNAVLALLPSLPPPPARIWCPADVDGSSHIVDVLREHGYYDVICSDISTGQDFLAYTHETMPAEVDVVVTNGPFSLKKVWLEHTVALGIERWAYLLPEIGLGGWAGPTLAPLGNKVGFIMLSRRIAYSEVFGQQAVSNPPYTSTWLCCGLHEPGEQIVFREVPARA